MLRKTILLNAAPANPSILASLLNPRTIRRAVDVIAVVGIALTILSHFIHASFNSLFIGAVCGCVVPAWWMSNFTRVKLEMVGAGSAEFAAVLEFFRRSALLNPAGLQEFSDARKTKLFTHWKFENIETAQKQSKIIVIGPLVHLRLLIANLREHGVNLADDSSSSYRMCEQGR